MKKIILLMVIIILFSPLFCKKDTLRQEQYWHNITFDSICNYYSYLVKGVGKEDSTGIANICNTILESIAEKARNKKELTRYTKSADYALQAVVNLYNQMVVAEVESWAKQFFMHPATMMSVFGVEVPLQKELYGKYLEQRRASIKKFQTYLKENKEKLREYSWGAYLKARKFDEE